MKTIKKEYQVFSFDELSEEAKDKAISDYINFILEVTPYEEMQGSLKKAVDKAGAMQTPWFTGSYVYDYCKDDMIAEMKLNEYDYFEDGAIFNK